MKKTGVIYRGLCSILFAYIAIALNYLIKGYQYYGEGLFYMRYRDFYTAAPYCYGSFWGVNRAYLRVLLAIAIMIFGAYIVYRLLRFSEEPDAFVRKINFRFLDVHIVCIILSLLLVGNIFQGWLLFISFMLISVWLLFVYEWTLHTIKEKKIGECFVIRFLWKNYRRIWGIFVIGFILILCNHWFLSNEYVFLMFTEGFSPVMTAIGTLLLPSVYGAIWIWLMVFIADLGRLNDWTRSMVNNHVDEETFANGCLHQEMIQNLQLLEKDIHAAVEERVKSERLKTELITNVSHDLKTPLTSVINYVQLLKREPAASEQAERYIEVLEQKTEQMRTLTEDIIELSRLMSNNVPVEKTELNFSEMVRQANGEFAEGFESRGLEVRCTLPEEDCILELDGQKTWRVLENLYTNVRKYAMGFSRVYVEVQEIANAVHFTMKNVSQAELSQAADELMERFVRGDQARTTEGSGLGLSIAKSLIEIQGGTFEIEISGDLFVAKVKLPR